jgi:DNA polymerase IV (DinB-like DNA polymerase)
MHIDLDAFFAACEERERKISGKPLVVGADPKQGKGRGVVSTCNYYARKFGIHSGMPISVAFRKCPDAVFLPVNFPLYVSVSEKIMNIVNKYADIFEQTGIDEAYLDVTQKTKGSYASAEEIAKKIKEEILNKEKLTCSIGIGPNKLIAKTASDYKKPDGLTVVRPYKIKAFLWPLEIRKLYGVGKKGEQVMKELGINTIGNLAEYDAKKLEEIFGSWGYELKQFAQGIDERPLEEGYSIKTIGREHTFEKDTSDPKTINDVLEEIAREIHEEIKQYKISFRTITLKIRYQGFETHTKSRTVKPSDKLNTIKDVSKELMKPYLKNRKIRLVGIRISNLVFGQKNLEEFLKS